MNNNICYNCNCDDFYVLLKINRNISIVKCRKCFLARTYPYPRFNFESEERYSKFYLDNEHIFRMLARYMIDVIEKHKIGGSFLDIGCSVGYLLDEAMAIGFKETFGVELNRDAVEIASKKGHTIYTQPLEKLHLENEKFDVICLNHVLEHIIDFKQFLNNVRKILKNNGIVYCSAPNYNSFMQRLLHKRWYGWGMPDHVWHFELKTFKRVLEENSLAGRSIKQSILYYPYSKSFRKNTRATLARISDALDFGDQLYGIFYKK